MVRRGATKKSRGRGRVTHGYVSQGFRVTCKAPTPHGNLKQIHSSLEEAAANAWRWVVESDGYSEFLLSLNGQRSEWQRLLVAGKRAAYSPVVAEDDDGSIWTDLAEELCTYGDFGCHDLQADEISFARFVVGHAVNKDQLYADGGQGAGEVSLFHARGPNDISIRIVRLFVFTRTG